MNSHRSESDEIYMLEYEIVFKMCNTLQNTIPVSSIEARVFLAFKPSKYSGKLSLTLYTLVV